MIVREQVLALNSEHEEADTLIIYMYHLHKLRQEQPGLSISVPCDDTDVLLLLLYHVTCGNIQARVFNNTRRYINISQIIMEESNPSLFDALLGFHAFTGCDFTAPFFGKGKQRPLERMKKIPGCMEAFAALGMHPTVPGHVMSTLESFVCAMYARPKMGSVNKARYKQRVLMHGHQG